MKFLRILAIFLGLTLISVWSYDLLTEHLEAVGSVIGIGVGLLFLNYGLTGKDLVERFFKKVLGYGTAKSCDS